MHRLSRKDKKAHERMRCWDRPVPTLVNQSHVRICPHGVVYTPTYDMFIGQDEQELRWLPIEEFFIRAGCYNW